MCWPILLDYGEVVPPRRRDIIGVVPKHVGRNARNDIGRGERGDRLRLAPRVGLGVDERELAVADERELRRLLDRRAPARRISARGGAVHDDAGDRELAFDRFAARFEIDRGGQAIGFLVERGVGRIAVDQRIERPAVAIEPRGLGRDRRGELERHRLRRLRLEDGAVAGATAVVAATAGRASVDATGRAGRAAVPTYRRRRPDRGRDVEVGELCALAPLEPIASMKNPMTADAPRPPKSLITNPLPLLAGEPPGRFPRALNPAGMSSVLPWSPASQSASGSLALNC